MNSDNERDAPEFNSCIDNHLSGLSANIGMQQMLEKIKSYSSFDENDIKSIP